MKLQEFRKLIREEIRKVIKENRVPFKGKTARDLYSKVKNNPNALVFVNGQTYSIDIDDLKSNLTSDVIYVSDKSGKEREVAISNIEFIEM